MVDTVSRIIEESRGGTTIKLSKRIYPEDVVWTTIAEISSKGTHVFVDDDGENWTIWIEGSPRQALEVATKIFSRGMDENRLYNG